MATLSTSCAFHDPALKLSPENERIASVPVAVNVSVAAGSIGQKKNTGKFRSMTFLNDCARAGGLETTRASMAMPRADRPRPGWRNRNVSLDMSAGKVRPSGICVKEYERC